MIIENNRIVLCGGGKCCPVITKEEENFVITDDYNGKVILTGEELNILRDAIDHFKAQNLDKNTK
jgi:hypothetical protein